LTVENVIMLVMMQMRDVMIETTTTVWHC